MIRARILRQLGGLQRMFQLRDGLSDVVGITLRDDVVEYFGHCPIRLSLYRSQRHDPNGDWSIVRPQSLKSEYEWWLGGGKGNHCLYMYMSRMGKDTISPRAPISCRPLSDMLQEAPGDSDVRSSRLQPMRRIDSVRSPASWERPGLYYKIHIDSHVGHTSVTEKRQEKFGQPSIASMAPMTLTPQQIEQFHRDGYLLLRRAQHRLVETDHLQRWTDEVRSWPREKGKWMPYDEITANGQRQLMRTENFVDHHAEFQALLCGPDLANTLKQLGDDVS